jgi:nicotinate-nucleotide adenylyltransferase
LKRIGINGGTFDPIHFGHLRPALEVLEACELEEMRFIPCYQPVHRDTPQASDIQRVEMVRRALAAEPRFVLDTREIDRGGPSFMVDTLRSLHSEQSDAAFVLMMGQDAFARFDAWHDWRGILALASIVVTQRPNADTTVPPSLKPFLYHGSMRHLPLVGAVGFLAVTQLDISSTAIRRRLAEGQSIAYLTPKSVIEYIKQEQLYH